MNLATLGASALVLTAVALAPANVTASQRASIP